mmetsp:Transcript_69814/g.134690  ORF Transcript_69814/g.134690 Transcript_69814/m.134690 type:complete len:111 (-) Transcript_69814:97-429(-)
MRTLLNYWALTLCLFSVFRGSATECSKASSEDEACEKMLLVTKKLPDEQRNAFLEEESEEGLEETEQATDKKSKKVAPKKSIRGKGATGKKAAKRAKKATKKKKIRKDAN